MINSQIRKQMIVIYFSVVSDPRTVILHRAKRGFGFVLRGAKAASPLMQLKPSERCPGLQYLDDVDPGGVADMAGLRPGDFLLTVSVFFFWQLDLIYDCFQHIRLTAKTFVVHHMNMSSI